MRGHVQDVDHWNRREFLEALTDVQDAIGEWHDWVELEDIASKVLKQDSNCRLMKKVQDISERKFVEALRLTEQMRRRYFPGRAPKRTHASKKPKRSLPGPVLVMASEMAA